MMIYNGLNLLTWIVFIILTFLVRRNTNTFSLLSVLIIIKSLDIFIFIPYARTFNSSELSWMFYCILICLDFFAILIIQKRYLIAPYIIRISSIPRFLLSKLHIVKPNKSIYKYRIFPQEMGLTVIYSISILVSILTSIDEWLYVQYYYHDI